MYVHPIICLLLRIIISYDQDSSVRGRAFHIWTQISSNVYSKVKSLTVHAARGQLPVGERAREVRRRALRRGVPRLVLRAPAVPEPGPQPREQGALRRRLRGHQSGGMRNLL